MRLQSTNSTSTITSIPATITTTIYTSPTPTTFLGKRSLGNIERSPLLESVGEPHQLENSASAKVKRDLKESDLINSFGSKLLSSACSCFATHPATQTIQMTVTSH